MRPNLTEMMCAATTLPQEGVYIALVFANSLQVGIYIALVFENSLQVGIYIAQYSQEFMNSWYS